ncbi:MAG: hypothetical protein VB853_07620 [Pirellulales bacterium]
MIHVICPYCQNQLPVAENWSGVIVCTRCNRQVAVQSTPASPAAPPPRSAAPPVAAPPASQPATSRGDSPQRYHRKKDNTAVIVSAVSGVGILIVGALLLVFVFSKDDDDLGNGRRGDSSRSSTTSTSDDKPRRNVERQKADDEKPRDRHAQLPNASGNNSQPATAAGGVTIADASSVFKEAISSWSSGTSHGGFLAAAGHVEKIDIPEWKEYAFDIEKSSIDPDKFSSNTERRFWLNVAFKNQGADPIRRLYAVKLGGDGRWTIMPLQDGDAEAEENKPAAGEAKPEEAKSGDPEKAAAAEAENAEREDE